jgi:phosphohistidine phosphatase
MKTLLLIRHAASEQGTGGTDFDRPLKKTGKRDALVMAGRLMEKGMKPDLLISSAAKRARNTARRMAAVWDYPDREIQLESSLYEAGIQQYEEVIRGIPDDARCVAVFGHNPTVGMLADSLTAVPIDRFPTCAIAAFSIAEDSWADFQSAEKTLLFVDFPKPGPD